MFFREFSTAKCFFFILLAIIREKKRRKISLFARQQQQKAFHDTWDLDISTNMGRNRKKTNLAFFARFRQQKASRDKGYRQTFGKREIWTAKRLLKNELCFYRQQNGVTIRDTDGHLKNKLREEELSIGATRPYGPRGKNRFRVYRTGNRTSHA